MKKNFSHEANIDRARACNARVDARLAQIVSARVGCVVTLVRYDHNAPVFGAPASHVEELRKHLRYVEVVK